ncbi:AAA family ATPase [Acinetobacter bereziniae]|uniref:AAA family ATPase n=1 Tax=Acinetobacter bereziniae TaxID=106648 RepID=UPI001901BF92|nr:AAA family ATPase [Acinetobacter bereziniae]MBJ8552032.1 AAA family ATPase [Acinetobacter bereziniae]
MAKASKKTNRFQNTGIPSTPVDVKEKVSISPLFQQVTGVVVDKEKEELLARDEQLRQEVKDALRKLELALEDARLTQVDYKEKVKLLADEDERLMTQESRLQKQEQELRRLESDLEVKKSELLEQNKKIASEKSALRSEQFKLQEQLATLADLKANAELGFALEKQKALEEKRVELDRLQTEALEKLSDTAQRLAEQEKKILEREESLLLKEAEAISGFMSEKKDLLNQQYAEIQALQNAWIEEKQQQEQELAQAKHEVVVKKVEIEQAEHQLKNDKDQFEATIEAMRNSIRNEFSVQITKLKSSNESLEYSHNQALDEIDALTAKLQQYADLERQLEGQGIIEVQEELTDLRERNRELRIKLSERSEEGLEEENERLEEKCDDLESQVFELRQRNNDLENELNNSRLSVMAKQHLQQEKRVLEEHKRVLDTSIGQLRTQIDDLVEKQQGELPFKSLSEMDQIYRSEARGLQAVPELQRFVSIMQSNIAKQKFYYSLKDIRLFIAGLAMSKLHLLQGISGTGKTSLARAFAKAINNATGEGQEKQYCEIVRVQAGWRDREDLLGHFNAFEKRFYTKEALQALYRAQQPKFKDTLQIILLDEMNLSQPEQYFADFLSLMETPDRAEINLLDSANEKAPELFINKRAIKIPHNVWFIGTANHDETTKEFADKTYDRAHVMEVKRSEEDVDISYANTEQYSFSSLMQSFEQAQYKHQAFVTEIFEKLQNSLLEEALKAVCVSWGNRLERQAYSFIPVYIEMGGSVSEALDHLFATKLFRKGKVTGRYDTRAEKIEDIISCLEEAWQDLDFNDEKPSISLELLNQDVERLKGNL